jgi:hypothetical protein
MKEELLEVFLVLDRLCTELYERGSAAYHAGDTQRQHQLENTTRHVYEARREIILALESEVTK